MRGCRLVSVVFSADRLAMPMCLWQENPTWVPTWVSLLIPLPQRGVSGGGGDKNKSLTRHCTATFPKHPSNGHESVFPTPSHKRTQTVGAAFFWVFLVFVFFFFLTILYRWIPPRCGVRLFRCRQFPRAGSCVIIALHTAPPFFFFFLFFIRSERKECPSKFVKVSSTYRAIIERVFTKSRSSISTWES